MSVVVEYVDGRVPVVCGAGSNNTEEAIGLVKHAEKIGADGVLVVTPYYNKPTQEGLFRHYEYLASRSDIPIILYNVPGRTGISISPETVARLAKIPRVVAIKEASGRLEQAEEIMERCALPVLSGEDALTFPLIAIGARGVISVTANVMPGRMHEMVHAALQGRMERARKLHRELYPLSRALFIETNPIPVKTALAHMGLIQPDVRLPLCAMGQENARKLDAVLKDLGVLA
jgi:4-hydroxy-tetrahydrodipicolinate synthase